MIGFSSGIKKTSRDLLRPHTKWLSVYLLVPHGCEKQIETRAGPFSVDEFKLNGSVLKTTAARVAKEKKDEIVLNGQETRFAQLTIERHVLQLGY